MIGSQLRPIVGRVSDPLVSSLHRHGVTPDAVTLFGTVGVVAGALVFFPQGWFFAGTLVITLFVLTDAIDGALARKRGTTSRFGAWLDSTCDRVADGAVFGSVALWYAGRDDVLVAVTLYVLVSSGVVSYAKARAEGLGMTCDVGVADRTARLLILLVPAGFVGLGVSDVLLAVALWVLAALTTVTIAQRYQEVRRQAVVTE